MKSYGGRLVVIGYKTEYITEKLLRPSKKETFASLNV